MVGSDDFGFSILDFGLKQKKQNTSFSVALCKLVSKGMTHHDAS